MRLPKWLVHLIVLWGFLLIAVLAYAPSMQGPLQFDDQRVILDKTVRERRDVVGFLIETIKPSRDAGGVLGTRGLVSATFLAQWQLHGKTTWPYHLFNVVIHVIASWLVFVLLLQLLELVARSRWHVANEEENVGSTGYKLHATRNLWLALFGAGVFLLHPLQTQSVAYISQRYESMMGMFYLAAVVGYLKARSYKTYRTYRTYMTYGVSLFSGFAAMSSKEVAVTLPVIILITEFLISKSEILNKSKIQKLKTQNIYKWMVVGLFFVLALKVPWQIIASADLGGTAPTAGDVVNQLAAVERPVELGMTRVNYLLTQFWVVWRYMLMLVVPMGQSIDHDIPLVQSLLDWRLGVGLVTIIGLLVMSYELVRRRQKLAALGVWWFFITLSVTSSVVPIRDVMYEHRLYLPMVGFALLLVATSYKLQATKIGKQGLVVGGTTLLAIYFVLTLFRANVWATEVNLWGDAWRKGPEKHRTNKNYGFVLTQAGRLAEGIERLEYAVKLNPEDQDYRITLGAAYLQAKEWEQARLQFVKATALKPEKADGWNNLGVALFQLKNYAESRQAFEKSIALDPKFQAAWLGIGGARLYLGDSGGGEEAFKKAIELEPTDPRAWANLVTLYVQTKQWKKAGESIRELERLDPKYQGLMERKQLIQKNLR